MESVRSFCERKLLGYTANQYIIMFVTFTIFLPYYFSLAAMVGVTIYLVCTRQLKDVFVSTPKSVWAIIFCLYSFAVSCYYNNYMGMGQSLGLFFIVIFILFYRKNLNPRLFTFIVDMCCLASICCFIWGFMEYASIVERLGYSFNELVIENAPEDRINSTFKNANHYAMMIEFLVLMCIYKILYAKSLHRVVFYTVTILCNLFALYLTGSRAGWVSFLITIPLIFYINHRKKTSYALCLLILSGVLVAMMNPHLIPRAYNIVEYFFGRIDIWITALKGIQESFVFGMGPSAYYLIYEKFNGPMTYHSHNVYIDPILSFGLVGMCLFFYFAWPVVREIYELYKKKVNVELVGLIVCFVITVLVHGLFDYTIFWIQTGTLFLLVFNGSCMYSKIEKM